MADGGSGGGDGAGAGGSNEEKVMFDGDQTTTSANSSPPPTNGGGIQTNPPPAGATPVNPPTEHPTAPPPADVGGGSGSGGSVGDSTGGDGLPIAGIVDGLLGGNGLASVSAGSQGGNPGLSVDVGGANDDGAGGHSHALIDVNANTGSDGALGSVLDNGAGIADLGSLLDGQKLVDVHAGSGQGNGDALVNVNADTTSILGGTDGAVGSLLGKGTGAGDLGSLLTGQKLLNVDAGSDQGSSDALVNVHADTGALNTVDDTVGSLLGNGTALGDPGSLLDGQKLLNVDAGPGQGSSDARINVHADTGTSDGTSGTLGSLLGNSAGLGDLGPIPSATDLVKVSPEPAGSSGDALVNVDTSGVGGSDILGNSTDMGLVAALTGSDGLAGVGLPLVDGPHEVSVLDIPVVDLHLQPDHA